MQSGGVPGVSRLYLPAWREYDELSDRLSYIAELMEDVPLRANRVDESAQRISVQGSNRGVARLMLEMKTWLGGRGEHDGVSGVVWVYCGFNLGDVGRWPRLYTPQPTVFFDPLVGAILAG